MRILALLLLCAAGPASANGFFLYEHDARVTGRGGAATATDVEPSAIVYNPGGIAVIGGTSISIGGSLVAPSATYYDPTYEQTHAESKLSVLPTAFITSKLGSVVAIGVGLHMPFGLAVAWPTSSPQAEIVTEQNLRTYFISPVIGLDLDRAIPGLSVGGGVDLVPATVELEQAVVFGSQRGTAALGGEAFGIGGRAGLMWRSSRVSIGAMWRSQVKLDFEGTGDFDIAEPYRAQLPPDGDIATTITLPMSVAVGLALRPSDRIELEVNAVWLDWSTFKQIAIDMPDGMQTVSPQNYEDTVTVRAGAELKLPEIRAAVRAGYIYDPTPVPATTISARLPDVDRHDLTVGLSRKLGDSFDLHFGLLWVIPNSRRTSRELYMPLYKGAYTASAVVGAVSLDARFGK
ncbi:MAG: OmpP1/FadL family transporter [Kofleriaceae bacterium]